MRYFPAIVGLLLALSCLSEAAVVQRRYRHDEEILVPVTIIQDGDQIPEIKNEPQVKSVAEDIANAVDKREKLEVAEAIVEAQRRIDEEILEEEIKEAVAEENKDLTNALREKEEQLNEVKPEEAQKEPAQVLKKLPTEEIVIQPEVVADAEQSVKEQQGKEQVKSVVAEEKPEELILPVITADNDEEPEGTLRQATQATPSQTTTQQNFVQQLIQNTPLGQFFNQISGQNNQGQVANDEAAATPSPTIPGFLAPAITSVQNAAQSVVNSTTSAFQGLQQFASNLGNQFQSTLSGLGGQQAAQQSPSEGTTVRPAGPFQQLVNTFIGGNQQATPAPTQQGPLQGLLNIFQGNNNSNNNNKPQGNDATAAITQADPAKQPEQPADAANDVIEEEAENTADELSNDIRSSAESEDSFEDAVHPEEMIVVQDDASQTQDNDQDQEQGHVPK